MKPGRPPERRTPLRRGKRPRPRREVALEIAESERARRTQVWEAVLRRDRVCVLRSLDPRHQCFGDRETPHHLVKAWKGGGYTFENLVVLCAAGNTWVEDNPDAAWRLGLVIREGETAADAAERRRDASR